MTQAPRHLTSGEVEHLLKHLEAVNAVVVGGQALALWCRLFLDRAPEIANAYSLTSEDLDVYGSAADAQTFAKLLGDAEVHLTPPFDNSPNAAVVTGKIGDHVVRVDFMRMILGVDARALKEHFITLTKDDGATGPIRFSLLHPLDCLRSRLSNINDLRREGVHAIRSAHAAMLVVDLFVDELLEAQEFRPAQAALMSLFYIGRDRCADKAAGRKFKMSPLSILQKYRLDVRLDKRWRSHQLAGAIKKLHAKSQRFHENSGAAKSSAES